MGLEDTTADAIEDSAAEAPGDKAALSMDKHDRGSEALVAELATGALAGALSAAAKPRDEDSKKIADRRFKVVTDASRDALLTDFGKETLDDRYLLPGETYQDLFARVADAYADDQDHAQRLYDYTLGKLFSLSIRT